MEKQELYFSLNLIKLKNAVLADTQNGKCVCIPIESNNLFLKDGAVYLSLKGVPVNKDYCTHLICKKDKNEDSIVLGYLKNTQHYQNNKLGNTPQQYVNNTQNTGYQQQVQTQNPFKGNNDPDLPF